MKKIKKFLIPALIAIFAIFGSLSYISKGSVSITSPVSIQNAESSLNTEITETVSENLVTDKVDLNSATSEELQIAPGIGPAKAEKIIEYRESYGGFSCVDELIEVSGIGEKTLAKIRDYYMVK